MTTWLSDISDEEQQDFNQRQAKGLPDFKAPKKEPGLFDGAASSVPRGIVAGAVKVAGAVRKPFERIADDLEYALTTDNDFDQPFDVRKPTAVTIHNERNIERRNKLVMEVAQLEDKENTGFVGNLGFGISDFATRAMLGSLVGGPAGAIATTGLSETNYSFEELRSKGVDTGTALGVGAVDGLVAGASASFPLTFGLKGTGGIIKDGALSVGGATGLSVGGQALSGEILKSNGYEKEAKKYEITKESVATEVGLNVLLFGAARYAQNRAEIKLKENLDPEAKADAINGGLVQNLDELDDIAPVKPSDPVQANNHLKNLNDATESLKAGRPINVTHSVKGEEKKKAITATQVANYTSKPWAKAIASEAGKRGINPVDAVVISHIETGGTFDPNIQPPINKKTGKRPSTATGLFQTIDSTFSSMGGKSKFDGNDQIKAGLNYYQHNASIFKKQFGRDPSGLEVYFMHFFGEGGGPVFLKAKDNELFIDVATRWSKGNRSKAQHITSSHKFDGMTVGDVKAKYQARWSEVAKKYGGDGSNVSAIHGLDGSNYDVAYEVKSLDELITSNDAAYNVNPNYPSELQPRDRTREASRQQIDNIANDLRPEWLGESTKLQDGAPIIGMDNVVESGNGRSLAINRAYEIGKADDYRAMVEAYAHEKGWDISGINKPILVRTRLTDTDRVEFSRLANESDVAQFSATERAITDADKLPDASLLKINSDGSINLDGSMDYIRGFVNQLPQSERATIITGDGRLSQDGKRRVESAITQQAYGDSNIITRLAENLDDDSKTVLNALLRSAPQLTQLNALVKQGGRHNNTIAKDLAQAVQKLSDIKANGQTVDDYLKQELLFDDGLSQGAKDFLNVFDTNKRSTKGIAENIQSKIDEIEAMGDPRQGSLFGDGPEESAALAVILDNPDQEISVSRIRPDGEVEEITMTLRERLDELEAEARQAQEDTLAAQTAITCALQFGA